MNLLHVLVLGGLIWIVYGAIDPVTVFLYNKGKIIVGFLIGVFKVLIRVFNPAYPVG